MTTEIIAAAILVFFLMRRKTGDAVTIKSSTIFDAAVKTALDAGVDPAVFLGIIEVESRWNPSATNLVGSDGARGGAYGLTQLTLRTARQFEPNVTGDDLLDPFVNLRIAGRLLAQNADAFSPQWPDVAASWNSGRAFNAAPEKTRYDYVPKVLAAADRYAKDPTLDLGEGES